MPNTTQIGDILFKKWLGLGTTQSGRQFFNEPILGRPFVVNSQIWGLSDQIPTTAPVSSSGVVQRLTDYPLVRVVGAVNSYSGALLRDTIPFNWDSAGSYNYTVKDDANNSIAFGSGDWTVDTEAGILMFNQTGASNLPVNPKISFWRYSGAKGFTATSANPAGVTGLAVSGFSPLTGYVQLVGVSGITVSQGADPNVVSFTLSAGANSYLFNSGLSSGIWEQFIRFPTGLGNNPTVIASVTNEGPGPIIPFIISGETSSGFWISFADIIPDDNYQVNVLASTTTLTGLVTSVTSNVYNITNNLANAGVGAIIVTGQPLSGNVGLTGIGGTRVTVSGTTIVISGGSSIDTGQFITTAQTGNFVPQSSTNVDAANRLLSDGSNTALDWANKRLVLNGVEVLDWSKGQMTGNWSVKDLYISGYGVITAGATGQFAPSGMTGQFVTTAQTGHIHSQYALSSNTGQFITTAQTGQYAPSGMTGQFVTTAQTGHIHSQYALSSMTGEFLVHQDTGVLLARGESGLFYPANNPNGYITYDQVGGVKSILVTGQNISGIVGVTGVGGTVVRISGNTITISGSATIGDTGQFITTAQTGQYAPSGMTGQFVTTAQTGHIHTQYALVSGTGQFITTAQTGNFITTSVTGGAFYPRYGNPEGFLTNATLPGGGGVTKIIVTGTNVSGNVTLAGGGNVSVFTGVPNTIIVSGDTGNLVFRTETGHIHSQYALASATGQFVDSSETGVFVTRGETGHIHSQYALVAGTGQFISTSQTGQYAPSGMTGQFVTTAQTGHIHSQYALVSGTGQFLVHEDTGVLVPRGETGAAFYPRYGNPEGFLTNATLPSAGGVNYLLVTGTPVSGNITLVGAGNVSLQTGTAGTNQIVISGVTGNLVFQGMTGQFAPIAQTGHIHSQYALVAGTGQFITTAQTGQYAPSGMTGQFVTTNKTGQFITTAQTGQFASYSNVVWTTGDQNISGTKSFVTPVFVSGRVVTPIISPYDVSGINAYPLIEVFSGRLWIYNGSTEYSPTVNWEACQLNTRSNTLSIDWKTWSAYDSTASQVSIQWNNRYLYDSLGATSVLWEARQLTNYLSAPTLDWNTQTLTGTWDVGGLTVNGEPVLFGNTGQFVTSTQTGLLVNAFPRRSETGQFAPSGMTGQFVTTAHTGHIHSQYALVVGTGQFISTAQTGQYAPSGMTGQFVTTAQTGHIHSQYALSAGTGQFITTAITGNAFYPRYGNPDGFLTNATLPGGGGVTKIIVTGTSVSGNVTLVGGGNVSVFTGVPNTIVVSGDTGNLVFRTETGHIHSQYALSAGTGQFITTAQTGDFVPQSITNVNAASRLLSDGANTSLDWNNKFLVLNGVEVLSWSKGQLTGKWSAQDLLISGYGVVTAAGTGQFVTTAMTGHIHSQYALSSNTGQFIDTSETGWFVTTGNTGVFVTRGETGHIHSQYALVAGTGQFISTAQTGQYAPSGMTGQFVTTAQTGHVHSQYALVAGTGQFISTAQTGQFAPSGMTGQFITTAVTGNAFYPRYGNPDGFLTNATLPGGGGVTKILVTGTSVSGNVTLAGGGNVSVFTGVPNTIIVSGDTGNLVFRTETGHIHSQYALVAGTGQFISTAQTGQFAPSGMTGQFVTTSQTGHVHTQYALVAGTGQFITTAQTGQYAPSGMTGQFVTTNKTGQFLTSAVLSNVVFTTGDQHITGSKTFDQALYVNDRIYTQILSPLAGGTGVSPSLNYPLIELASGKLWVFNGSTAYIPTVNWNVCQLNTFSNTLSINWNSWSAYDSNPTISINWSTRILSDSSAASSIDWQNRLTYDSLSAPSIDWSNRQLSGNWDAEGLTINGQQIVIGDTGQFVTTAMTGHIHSQYALTGNTGQFVTTAQTGHIHSQYALVAGTGQFISTAQTGQFAPSGMTGQFVTTAQTGHIHSQYALVAGTGQFITTAQTGQYAPSGMTGQFVTTAQTGHIHSQYALATSTGQFIDTSETGIFVARGETGAAFYPRYGNPAGYLTSVGAAGVTSLVVTGTSLTGSITFSGAGGITILTGYSGTNQIAISGWDTGQYVTTAMTGHVHSQYALVAGTGQFITTAQTGQYAPAGMTGQFITTAQTGNFVPQSATNVNAASRLLSDGSNTSLDWANKRLVLNGVEVLDWSKGQLTGNWSVKDLYISGYGVITSQSTGQFVTTAQTGHIHSQYALASSTGQFVDTSETGWFVTTGNTGVFVTIYQTGHIHSQYALVAGTGQFISTAQTGQYAPSGMTGQFVTTAQTGHVHSQYALVVGTGQFISTAQTGQFAPSGMTGQFITTAVTGNAFYPRYGNPEGFLTNATLPGGGGVTKIIVTGTSVSGNITLESTGNIYVITGLNNTIIVSGYTGDLVFQGNTGQFAPIAQTGHIHSQYALVAGTGQFISTAQTGQFAPSGMTGQFVSTAQTGHIHSQYALVAGTGQFITTAQTGQYAPSGMTGQFVTTAQTGHIHSQYALSAGTGQFVTTAQTGHIHSQYLTSVTPVGVTGIIVTGYPMSGGIRFAGGGLVSVFTNGPDQIIFSGDGSQTGQFVDSAQSGLLVNAFPRRTETGQYAPSGMTGQFVTTAQTGHIHSQYALVAGTGQFISTAQTGQFAPSGMTGQFVTTAQTGHIHSQYALVAGTGQFVTTAQTGHIHSQYLTSVTPVGVTSLFVTGQSISGNISVTGVSGISVSVSGANTLFFSTFAITNATGQFVTTAQTGHIHSQYALVDGTGQFVTTAQTGHIHSQYALVAGTGQFISTAQTGQFAPSGMTGQFVTTAQTGHVHSQYALASSTGQFVDTSETGQFLTTNYQTAQVSFPLGVVSPLIRYGNHSIFNLTSGAITNGIDGTPAIIWGQGTPTIALSGASWGWNAATLCTNQINAWGTSGPSVISVTNKTLIGANSQTWLDWSNATLKTGVMESKTTVDWLNLWLGESGAQALNWRTRTLTGQWDVQGLTVAGQSLVYGNTGQFVDSSKTGNFVTNGMTGKFVNLDGYQVISGPKVFSNTLGASVITGGLNAGGSSKLDLGGSTLTYRGIWDTGVFSVVSSYRYLADGGSSTSVDWENRWLYSKGGAYSLNWHDKNMTGFWSVENLLMSGTTVALANQTGQFVTTNKTGQFVDSSKTGQFIDTSKTGRFAPYPRTVWTTGDQDIAGYKKFQTSIDVTGTIYTANISEYSTQVANAGNVIDMNACTLSEDNAGITLDWNRRALTGTWDAQGLTVNGQSLLYGNTGQFVDSSETGQFLTTNYSGNVALGGRVLINGGDINAAPRSSTDSLVVRGNTAGGQVAWFYTPACYQPYVGIESANGNWGLFGARDDGNLFFQTKNVNGAFRMEVVGGTLGRILGLRYGASHENTSAYMSLAGGTSAATYAPLKFTSGILLATPESGAMEYDGKSLYITNTAGVRNYILTGTVNWTGGLGGAGGGVSSIIYSGGGSFNGNVRFTGFNGVIVSGNSTDNMICIDVERGVYNLGTGQLNGHFIAGGGWYPRRIININWTSGETFSYLCSGTGYGAEAVNVGKLIFVHTGVVNGKTITCSFTNTGCTFPASNGEPAFSGEPRIYSGVHWEDEFVGGTPVFPGWIGLTNSTTSTAHTDVYEFTCVGKMVFGKRKIANAFIPNVIAL